MLITSTKLLIAHHFYVFVPEIYFKRVIGSNQIVQFFVLEVYREGVAIVGDSLRALISRVCPAE
jgi:hypothetical protein